MIACGSAKAAENGAGFYLLGSRGPGAGLLPPPGLFVENDIYIYDGHLGGAKSLPLGGNVVAHLNADLYGDFLTFLAVAPWQVAGGNLGFSVAIPVGGPTINARTVLTGPRGRSLSGAAADSAFTIGDLVFGATLGWHADKFHWTANVSVNTPTGDYRPGALSNIAFHRWAVDFTGALTWLDPQSGWDLSAAFGITLNGRNPTTDYKTGTEMHLEWGVTKYLSKEFSLGVLGYYYQQVTGDSGSGAVLGGFKGRVTALGVHLTDNFQVGALPVSARLKLFQEFHVKNRLEGKAVFLSVSMPLAVFGK